MSERDADVVMERRHCLDHTGKDEHLAAIDDTLGNIERKVDAKISTFQWIIAGCLACSIGFASYLFGAQASLADRLISFDKVQTLQSYRIDNLEKMNVKLDILLDSFSKMRYSDPTADPKHWK